MSIYFCVRTVRQNQKPLEEAAPGTGGILETKKAHNRRKHERSEYLLLCANGSTESGASWGGGAGNRRDSGDIIRAHNRRKHE